MTTFVITDAETDEVIACVAESGEAVLRDDVELYVYQGTEPVFCNTTQGVALKKNTFIIREGGKW